MDLKSINSFTKSLFLSKETILFLTDELLSTIDDNKEVSFLLDSYRSFILDIPDLYGHGTGSYALKRILKSGYLFSDNKILTGESSTDMIISPREFTSFSQIDSIHNLFLLISFSLASTIREKLKKEMIFKEDKEFPDSLFKDIAYLQQKLYPEIAKGRVKKMLKMENVPEKVTQEQLNEAYNLWFSLSKNRLSFRSRKVENLSLKAFESIRKSFLNNKYPVVYFDGIRTNDINRISKGLNLYTPQNLKDSKYHLLRALYKSLTNQNILQEKYLNNQEQYKEYIFKEVLKILNYKSPYYLKILKPAKDSQLLKELENQFPVLICFTLPENIKISIFSNTVKHMTYELRSNEKISVNNFKYILVPYKRISSILPVVKDTSIKVLPLEIVEMIRSVLHKYASV